jgi:hypothetical protein
MVVLIYLARGKAIVGIQRRLSSKHSRPGRGTLSVTAVNAHQRTSVAEMVIIVVSARPASRRPIAVGLL